MTKHKSSTGLLKLIIDMILGLIIGGSLGGLFTLLEQLQLVPFSRESYWTLVWLVSIIGGGFLSARVSLSISNLFGDALYDGLITSVIFGTVGLGWRGIIIGLLMSGLFLTVKHRSIFFSTVVHEHSPPLDDLTYGRALATSLRHSAVIEYNAGQFEGLLLRALRIIHRRRLKDLMEQLPDDAVDLMLEENPKEI